MLDVPECQRCGRPTYAVRCVRCADRLRTRRSRSRRVSNVLTLALCAFLLFDMTTHGLLLEPKWR